MPLETIPFDVSEHLDSEEAIAVYLSEALAAGDAAYFAHALGQVAKARGMTQIAREAGLGRESLYKALREDGNPRLDTIFKVLHALGVKLEARPEPAH